MGYVLTLFILFLNSINITHRENSKILLFILLLLLVILMGCVVEIPDLDSYEGHYWASQYFDYEFDLESALWYGYPTDFGFTILNKIFFSLGLPYEFFRFCIPIIGLTLIHQTVKKFLRNQSVFYLFYFIYPCFIDLVQIRNFLVMAFFVYAFPYMLENHWRKKIKYIVCILLAATIHKVAILYLFFYFIPAILICKRASKIFYCIIFIMLLMPLYADSIKSNLEFFLAFSEYNSKISLYTKTVINYGYLLYWGHQIVNLMLLRYMYKQVSLSKDIKTNTVQEKYPVLKLIYQLNLFMCIFLPLYAVNGEFTRIFRNALPLTYIAFILYSDIMIKYSWKRLFFIISIGGFLIITSYFEFYNLYSTMIVKPAFEDNYFFGFLNKLIS